MNRMLASAVIVGIVAVSVVTSILPTSTAQEGAEKTTPSVQLLLLPAQKVGHSYFADVYLAVVGKDKEYLNTRLAVNASGAPEPFREISIDLSKTDGRSLEFLPKIRIGVPDEQSFQVVRPTQIVGLRLDLNEYFGTLAPGLYTMTATYENQTALPAKAVWTGKITSDPVKFTVTAQK